MRAQSAADSTVLRMLSQLSFTSTSTNCVGANVLLSAASAKSLLALTPRIRAALPQWDGDYFYINEHKQTGVQMRFHVRDGGGGHATALLARAALSEIEGLDVALCAPLNLLVLTPSLPRAQSVPAATQ